MIDRPKPEETESLVAIAQATGFFNPEEIAVVRELLGEYQAREEESGYIWAVYRSSPGAAPIGFVCYGPVPMSADVYDLYWIAVDPRRQSEGVGGALLSYAEEALVRRRARQLYIETSDTPRYAPTRAFYERRGYEQVAHLTDYYHVGDGKVVYRKVFGGK